MITAQRIKISAESKRELAKRYYSTLFVLNGLKLTPTEALLMGFIATEGASWNKKSFAKLHNCSGYSINNTVYQLKKKGLLEKRKGKIQIPEKLLPDFSKPMVLQISLDVKRIDLQESGGGT